jgi:DNA repair protein RadC
MPLSQLPPDARPREKLHRLGPSALADAELLALLLRTGTSKQDVLQLAQSVLTHLGGLACLVDAKPEQLGAVHGVGPAKASELIAVMEIAKRAARHQLTQRTVLTQPQAVRDYVALHLREQPRECFAVLFLDSQHRLLTMETLFEGTLNQTAVYPREVVRRALLHNAAALILAHNHPSGVAEPSRADEHLTQALKSALALVDVRVLDHIVVARESTVSMAERGLL